MSAKNNGRTRVVTPPAADAGKKLNNEAAGGGMTLRSRQKIKKPRANGADADLEGATTKKPKKDRCTKKKYPSPPISAPGKKSDDSLLKIILQKLDHLEKQQLPVPPLVHAAPQQQAQMAHHAMMAPPGLPVSTHHFHQYPQHGVAPSMMMGHIQYPHAPCGCHHQPNMLLPPSNVAAGSSNMTMGSLPTGAQPGMTIYFHGHAR